MKKTLFILLTLSFFLVGFSQSENGSDYKGLKGRIEALENSNQKLQKTYDSLADLISNKEKEDLELRDSVTSLNSAVIKTNARIDDKRLQKSLDVAESTLIKQNFLIDGFSYILAAFTIIIALLAIIFAFISRRIINDATNATDRLNDRMDYFDEKVNSQLNEKFDDYELRVEKRTIDELFKDLNCKTPTQRRSAYERLFGIESYRIKDRVNRLFSLLNSHDISREEKSIIVEVLIQIDNDERN